MMQFNKIEASAGYGKRWAPYGTIPVPTTRGLLILRIDLMPFVSVFP